MLPLQKKRIRDDFLTQYVNKIDKSLTIADMIQPTIAVIKALASEVLKDHYLYLSTIYNPQEEAKELSDEICQAVKRLQKLMTSHNQNNVQAVQAIEAERELMSQMVQRMS